MYPTFKLSSIAAALAATMVSSSFAAQPLNLQNTTFDAVKKNFHLAVPGVLQASSVSADTLKVLKQRTDKNQVTHVRMQQVYAGFPVFGGYAITHSKHAAKGLLSAQSDVKMNGVIYQGLNAELGKAPASFVKEGQKALEQFKAHYAGKELSEEQVTPMVYMDEKNQAHWAYQVSVFVRHEDKIPERPTAIIDAKTYKPFVQWNDIKTIQNNGLVDVKGLGFGGNEKTGEYQFGKQLPVLELTRDEDKEECFLENNDVKVVDMESKYYSNNKAMRFDCKRSDMNDDGSFWTGYKADGYDNANGAASPTNDALYTGYVIKHMYHDWYNVEALKNTDGSAMQLVMRVHYGSSYQNAYWDGRQMTFGDGGSMMYPLVSIGVGSHEISHGFTEQHSGLNYFGQSGGMNEAFSDMAAQGAEYYSNGTNSWQIGSEIMKESSGWDALRYMDKPSRDGRSIDTADEYYGGLDVHYSSGVYNRLYYLIANQPGWDARKALDVMVKANMDYWTPYTNFKEGACGVISATQDLGYALDDVRYALKEVAIDYSACLLNIPSN